MTQEDKQLLLADLCGRLPYGVFVNIEGFDYDFNGKLVQVYFGNINRCSIQVGSNISYSLEETKPWLRPMSSMTEEERKELRQEHIKDEQLFADCIKNHPEMRGLIIPHFAADWCDKNMVDYRGLIPAGLAIEAPEGMYEKEKQQ